MELTDPMCRPAAKEPLRARHVKPQKETCTNRGQRLLLLPSPPGPDTEGHRYAHTFMYVPCVCIFVVLAHYTPTPTTFLPLPPLPFADFRKTVLSCALIPVILDKVLYDTRESLDAQLSPPY